MNHTLTNPTIWHLQTMMSEISLGIHQPDQIHQADSVCQLDS